MREIDDNDLAIIFKAQGGNWSAYNFIEIAHPDMAEPLRFVDASAPKVHLSNTYDDRVFEFSFPSESRTISAEQSLTIDDTDLALTYFYNSYKRTKRATLTLFTVASSNLDVKLISNYTYLIKTMTFSNDLANIALVHEDMLKEKFPFVTFGRHYPALHGVSNGG